MDNWFSASWGMITMLVLVEFADLSQRWSRGHKARNQGQEHKKNLRPNPRTAFPKTNHLEVKDRNARDQGQGPRTLAQVFSKKRSPKFFCRQSPKEENKKGLRKFFARFLAFSNKILTVQKIVLSSCRGQGNFRELEASRPMPRTWSSRPRPSTSKRVL